MAMSSGPALSQVEVSSAVMEMRPFFQLTADAVQCICDLLNALIGRVNTIEGWPKVAEPAIAASSEFMAQKDWRLL